MKRLLLLIAFFPAFLKAQTTAADDWKKVYRSFATKVNDVVHTRLDVQI